MGAQYEELPGSMPQKLKRKMSAMGAAFANGPWPAAMNMFEPNITAALWFDKAPSLSVIAEAFEKHIWPCHRFNCCIEHGHWVPRHSSMDRSYHFTEQSVKDEAEIERIAVDIQLSTLDVSYPRWKVIVLRTLSPNSKSGVVIHAHHALGDGLGMMFALSPLIGVEGGNPLSKVPLPNTVLPPSARKALKPEASSSPGSTVRRTGTGLAGCLLGLVKGVSNFLRGALITLLAKHDSELSINEPQSKRNPILPFSGKRAFTRFPPVSMGLIKAVREKHQCSMNDVVMAALTGAFRRYAMEVKDDKLLRSGAAPVEFKSLVMIALPRKVDESNLAASLCNKILFASMRLPIDERLCQQRLQRTKAACDDLKSMSYMTGLKGFTSFVSAFAPQSVLNKAAGEAWSKHTLCVTNVPATSVPMTWPAEGGELVQAASIVIANVMSQVSIVTYNGQVYASLVADPDLFPQAQVLGDMWLSEIKDLALPSRSPLAD